MKKILFLIALAFNFVALRGQDIYYSNYQQSLIALNPSFAGSNGGFRNQTNFRAKSGYFSTYASCDMFVKKLNAGFALTYNHDDSGRGLYKNDVFNFSYAQHLYVFDKQIKLIPSLQVGGFVRHTDRSKLSFPEGDMANIYLRTEYPWVWSNITPVSQKANFDASAGLMIQHKNFIFGSSVCHFTQPDEGLYGVQKLPFLLNIHSSYNWIIKEKFLINLSGRFMHQQYFDGAQFMSKAVLFKHYMIGVGYETYNGIVYNVGYKHNSFNVSITGTYHFDTQRATAEIGVSYTLRNKDQRKQLNSIENW